MNVELGELSFLGLGNVSPATLNFQSVSSRGWMALRFTGEKIVYSNGSTATETQLNLVGEDLIGLARVRNLNYWIVFKNVGTTGQLYVAQSDAMAFAPATTATFDQPIYNLLAGHQIKSAFQFEYTSLMLVMNGGSGYLKTMRIYTSGLRRFVEYAQTTTMGVLNIDYKGIAIPDGSEELFAAFGIGGGNQQVFVFKLGTTGTLERYYYGDIENVGAANNWGVVSKVVLKGSQLAVFGTNSDTTIFIYQLTCHGDCETCHGPAYNNCNSCYPSNYLSGSECIYDCMAEGGWDYENPPGSCGNCITGCVSCSSGTGCSTCDSPEYVMVGAPGPTATCDVDCSAWTPAAYPSGASCSYCPTGCSSCASANHCDGCLATHFYAENYLDAPNKLCYPNCSTSQHIVTPTNACEECVNTHQNQCVACTEAACTACVLDFVLVSGACVCEPTTHYVRYTGVCTIKPEGCDSVGNTGSCLTCDAGYYRVGTKCYIDCPAGQSSGPSVNTCQACSTLINECQACTFTGVSHTCQSCSPMYAISANNMACDIVCTGDQYRTFANTCE